MAAKDGDSFSVAIPQGDHELEHLNGGPGSGRSFSPSLTRQVSHQLESPAPLSQLANNPAASILGYCLASISMTVVNKYVVSGSDWNLMFLYLAIQVSVEGSVSPSIRDYHWKLILHSQLYA